MIPLVIMIMMWVVGAVANLIAEKIAMKLELPTTFVWLSGFIAGWSAIVILILLVKGK